MKNILLTIAMCLLMNTSYALENDNQFATLLDVSDTCPDFLVIGQSNAVLADWTYFENKTGYSVRNIAMSGRSIDYLIAYLPYVKICKDNIKGYLMMHGEQDAAINATYNDYRRSVETYRLLLGGKPLFLNAIGDAKQNTYEQNVVIRQVQLDHHDNWLLAYKDANWFFLWGMMQADGTHYNKTGQEVIMNAFANAVLNYDF